MFVYIGHVLVLVLIGHDSTNFKIDPFRLLKSASPQGAQGPMAGGYVFHNVAHNVFHAAHSVLGIEKKNLRLSVYHLRLPTVY